MSNIEHPLNRHLVIADNYNLLRGLRSESVDLITTDPPFAKNGTFVGSLKPSLSQDEMDVERSMLARWGINSPQQAADAGIEWPQGETTAKFKDIWSWETDVHETWIDELEDTHAHIARLIDNIRYTHSDGVAAYIAFMAVRLIECHRILKPTGALFLHCDHTASGYLRMLLDGIFRGGGEFRNEIVWCYAPTGRGPKLAFHRKHDTIFYYGRSTTGVFTPQYGPISDATAAAYSTNIDPDGRKWGLAMGRKRYLDEVLGRPVPSWWADIPAGSNMSSRERTGYPTQKPWALAERIIKAASNEGDVVLDPFAGCAYTAVAAETLGRQWIGCDISPRSLTVMRRQFAKRHWAIDGVAPPGMLEGLEACNVTVVGPGEVPVRESIHDPVPSVKQLPERIYKRAPASDMPHREMREILGRLSGWQCWACGYATRTIDGAVVESSDHFHLDHVEPKSGGGSNKLWNRALLCAPCNNEKRDRQVTLAAFRDELTVKARRASYGIVGCPVDLQQVRDQANDEWSAWRAAHGFDAAKLHGIR